MQAAACSALASMALGLPGRSARQRRLRRLPRVPGGRRAATSPGGARAAGRPGRRRPAVESAPPSAQRDRTASHRVPGHAPRRGRERHAPGSWSARRRRRDELGSPAAIAPAGGAAASASRRLVPAHAGLPVGRRSRLLPRPPGDPGEQAQHGDLREIAVLACRSRWRPRPARPRARAVRAAPRWTRCCFASWLAAS